MDIHFETGQIYENRKGSYTVLKINRRKQLMLIRYLDTGETQKTSMEFQARVYQNILWEREAEERELKNKERRFLHGFGKAFAGLQETDFKTSTEGTRWRSRASLTGRVARILSTGTPDTFISWAIYGWPVAFLTHREDYDMAAFETGSCKAKFTIELDERFAYYGFYIEKNDGPMDARWDWPRLLAALQFNESLQQVICQSEIEHGARFIARMSQGEEHFHYSNGLERGAQPLWDETNASSQPISERLKLFKQIPGDYWGEVYIIAQLPKAEAIQQGVKVSDTIAGLMRSLMPVYRAAVGPRQ